MIICPSMLPDNYKSLVIQEWPNGEQRDKIAVDNGLSAGSVTNIVNRWSGLGFPYSRCIKGISGNFEEGWYYCSSMCLRI
jgi:hypothetical protein